MSENENQKTLEEENIKNKELKEEETKEEIKETKIEEKNEINKVKENEQETKNIENDSKKEEIKDEKNEEKDNKNEETKKDENENDDDEEQKKLIKSINELKSESLKAKAIILYDLNEDMKSEYLDNYKSEKLSIELKELDNFLNYYNKIREIINSSVDEKEKIFSLIEKENKEKYSIVEKEEEKEKDEFTPIKNFWSESLKNAKFFELSEKDKKILENLIDIKFIPLDYPSFKIEFIFKENEYLEENTIYKIYHFQKNEKDEIEKTESSQIKWKSDEKNPTIKITIKRKKKQKEIITKEVDSFFNIFKAEDKEEKLDKELVEANFFRNDFLENMLEYYLNIMEFKYNEENDDNEDEDEK